MLTVEPLFKSVHGTFDCLAATGPAKGCELVSAIDLSNKIRSSLFLPMRELPLAAKQKSSFRMVLFTEQNMTRTNFNILQSLVLMSQAINFVILPVMLSPKDTA